MRVRNKYLLIMAVVWGPCLALAGASYALVLRPQIEDRRELDTKIGAAKEHYARSAAAARPESLALLTEQVDRLNGRVSDFLVGVETAPQAQENVSGSSAQGDGSHLTALCDLAFDIGKLAHETRLESFGMKPACTRASSTLPETEHIGEKRVNVSFYAGFPHFAAFLNALERHHPAVFVETFTISRPLEADARPRVDMGLAVLVEKPQGD